MTGQAQDEQLELLPSAPPESRRAALLVSDLTGFEHAAPDSELVDQIARLGLLQPVVVAGTPRRRYRVIEGRRRAKAVQLLAAEGRWTMPARLDAVILQGVDGTELMPAGMMLALHASRAPSPASELQAIEAILAYGSDESQTIKQIAAYTGMPVQTVGRRLRLRSLVPALRAAFDRGEISVAIAEAAARLGDEQQTRLEVLLAGGERLTLRAVREIARERTATAAGALPTGLFADRDTPWRARCVATSRLQVRRSRSPRATAAWPTCSTARRRFSRTIARHTAATRSAPEAAGGCTDAPTAPRCKRDGRRRLRTWGRVIERSVPPFPNLVE